jgi:hypothetical protein
MSKHTATLERSAPATPPREPQGGRAPAPAPGPPTPNGKAVCCEEDIRLCAYCKWEAAGKPGGDGVNFWLEAEKELLKRS